MSSKTTPTMSARTLAAAATLRDSLALSTLAEHVGATREAEHETEAARKMLAEAAGRFGSSLLISAPQVFAWNTPAEGQKHGVSFRAMRAEHGVTVSVAGLSYLRHVGHILALHPEAQTAEAATEVHALVRKIDDSETLRKIAESKTADVLAALRRAAQVKAETVAEAAATEAAATEAEAATPEADDTEAATPATLDSLAAEGPVLRHLHDHCRPPVACTRTLCATADRTVLYAAHQGEMTCSDCATFPAWSQHGGGLPTVGEWTEALFESLDLLPA
jgi:hypothetical protein